MTSRRLTRGGDTGEAPRSLLPSRKEWLFLAIVAVASAALWAVIGLVKPPAPGARKTHDTVGILQRAYRAETNDYTTFMGMARVAAMEGMPQVAAGLRAASQDELGLASAHGSLLRVLGAEPELDPERPRVGATADNLTQAIATATEERDEFYPAAIVIAHRERVANAEESLEAARGAAGRHAATFGELLQALRTASPATPTAH